MKHKAHLNLWRDGGHCHKIELSNRHGKGIYHFPPSLKFTLLLNLKHTEYPKIKV